MSTTKRAVSNVFWLILSEVSTRAVIFLGTIYLARVLGKSGFGLYSLFLAVAAYFWAVADFGITNYGTREVARDNRKTGQLYIVLNSLRFFLATLLFLTFCIVLYFIEVPMEKKLVILAGSFYAVSYSVSSDWVFRGLEKMQYIIIGRSITTVCFIVCIFIFVKSPSDSFLASMIYSCSFLIGSLSFIFILLQEFNLKFYLTISFSEWLYHIKESVFFAINGIFNSVAVFIPIFFMGMWSTNEDLGIFSAPHRIIVLVINTGTLVTFALYPTLSGLFLSDNDKFMRAFIKFRDILMGASIPACIVLTVISKDIILLLFGPAYVESTAIFNILIWLIFISLMKRCHSVALFSADLHRFNMFATGIGVFIVLLVSLFSIHTYGGYGAAWALIAGEAFTLVLLIGLLIKKIFSSNFFSYSILKVLLACLAMLLLITTLPFPEIPNILIGVAVYLVLSVCLGIVPRDTIQQVYKKLARQYKSS